MQKQIFTTFETRLGQIIVVSDGTYITGVHFAHPTLTQLEPAQQEPKNQLLVHAQQQIEAYLGGIQSPFSLPYRFTSGTAFQQSVWTALTTVSYGTTISYQELAERIGAPTSVRAVGTAAGKNPLLLILPCHRIIGSDGDLRGFAAGLERKQALLDLEQGRYRESSNA